VPLAHTVQLQRVRAQDEVCVRVYAVRLLRRAKLAPCVLHREPWYTMWPNWLCCVVRWWVALGGGCADAAAQQAVACCGGVLCEHAALAWCSSHGDLEIV